MVVDGGRVLCGAGGSDDVVGKVREMKTLFSPVEIVLVVALHEIK